MARNNLSILIILCLLSWIQAASLCPNGQIVPTEGNKCVDISCPDGQYYDATEQSCMPCDQICSKCSFFPDFCSECQEGFYLYNDKCLTQCPQVQTFVSCTNNVCTCSPCNSSCIQCFGGTDTDCLRCNSSFYFNPVNTSCKKDCEDGYSKLSIQSGDSITLTCQRCSSNCRTCDQNNPTICLDCKENMYLYENTCLTACPDQFQKLRGNCVPCPAGCLHCYNENPQSCSSCMDNYYLSIEDQSCLSLSCPAGFIFDSTKKMCLPCHPSCKSCTDQTSDGCAQCQNGYSLAAVAPSKCLNRCKDGQYASNTACISCNTSICSTCFGSGTNQCTSCQSDYYLFKTECVVVCPIQEYTYALTISGQPPSCQYCPEEMEQCQQDPNNPNLVIPVLCKSGYYLQNNQCLKQCQDTTFYADDSSRSCIPCQFPCLQCISSKSCISCVSSTVSQISMKYQFSSIMKNDITGIAVLSEQCLPTCPDGYFSQSSTNTCQKCNSNCMTCTGPSETDCVTCQKYDEYNQLFRHNSQCFYSCPSSQSNPMYGDTLTQECKSCSGECASCFAGDNSSCYSCRDNYYLEYLKPECKTFCSNENTYKESATNSCELCKFGCATCFDGLFNSCLSCLSGFYFESDFQVCKSCPDSCASCQSLTECDACNPGYLKLANGCVNACPMYGYFHDIPSSSCLPCDNSCVECFGDLPTQCISCKNQTYLGSDSSCQPCFASCDSCSGPLESDCSDILTCPQGEFLFDGECLTCLDSCGTCSGNTYDSCITCASSNYTLLFDVCKLKTSSSDTSCDIGFYYDSIEGKCFSCHPSCTECTAGTSSECTACAEGYLIHKEINTCSQVCLDGYFQENLEIPECSACVFNCTNGCSVGFSMLMGICYSECPFGTASSEGECIQQTVPLIKFSKEISNTLVNVNLDSFQVQVHVFSMGLQYSVKWSILENGIDVSYSTRFIDYLKNRGTYISIPPKVMYNNAGYSIKAELLTSKNSNNYSANSAEIASAFTTIGTIQEGTFELFIDNTLLTVRLLVSQWNFLGFQNNSELFFDFYLSISENDYFFLAESSPYLDGNYIFDLPNGNYAKSQPHTATFTLIVYNEYDISILLKTISIPQNILLQSAIKINSFSDFIYQSITTAPQIQRAAFDFSSQLGTLLSSSPQSSITTPRHLFFQAYYAVKGEQLECDSKIHCSGRGQCSWQSDNYNEVVCTCNSSYAGRYCEFDSFSLDVARQHLMALTDKIYNSNLKQVSELFMTLEAMVSLTKYSSIFDEFTLSQISRIYMQLSSQLVREEQEGGLANEKLLFKIAKLTSQLIHLANENESISYDDQRKLLQAAMSSFENQLSLFLQSLGQSYADLLALDTLASSFTTDVADLSVVFIEENSLLDASMQLPQGLEDNNNNEEPAQQLSPKLQISSQRSSFTLDLNSFSSKQSLSAAVVEWKSNPFLPLSQYEAPFITTLAKLFLYSGKIPVHLTFSPNSYIEIALPKILPMPPLPIGLTYLSPYICVYLDQVDQSYKMDGVRYVRENLTHIICSSEELSGTFGVLVNWPAIDSKLNLTTIWSNVSPSFNEDLDFQQFIQTLIEKQSHKSNQQGNPHGSLNFTGLSDLAFACSIYGTLVVLAVGLSLLRNWKDTAFEFRQTEALWLVFPIYSVLCGPFSSVFSRLGRAVSLCSVTANHVMFSAIFSLAINVDESDKFGFIKIGVVSCFCSIFVFYLTIGMINFLKVRWLTRQYWIEFSEDKLTVNVTELAQKGLHFYNLIFYTTTLVLQLIFTLIICILLITNDKQQTQAFLPAVLSSFAIDALLDCLSLILFYAVSKLFSAHRSSLILFFTLRGFYFPPEEFYVLEKRLRQLRQPMRELTEEEKQEELQQQQIFSEQDDEEEEILEIVKPQVKVFKNRQEYVKHPQEANKLQELALKLETKW